MRVLGMENSSVFIRFVSMTTLSLGFVDAQPAADSEWEDIDYNMDEIDCMIANAYPQAYGTLCQIFCLSHSSCYFY